MSSRMRQRAAYQSDDSVLCWQKCIASATDESRMECSWWVTVLECSRMWFWVNM